MAWNPNKPQLTDVIVDSITDIRENFQHLDPLAPVVGELQTVSELAPVAGELQSVSELAPYVQALRDSRIVEMGSNANGEYVRWENGLQVTFSKITFTNLVITTQTLGWYRNTGNAAVFAWPAAFATGKTPVVIPVPHELDAPFVTVGDGTNQTRCSLLFWRPTSATVTVTASVLAIGGWK